MCGKCGPFLVCGVGVGWMVAEGTLVPLDQLWDASSVIVCMIIMFSTLSHIQYVYSVIVCSMHDYYVLWNWKRS